MDIYEIYTKGEYYIQHFITSRVTAIGRGASEKNDKFVHSISKVMLMLKKLYCLHENVSVFGHFPVKLK